ncbi:MAG TPA: ParB/RepB/Spo0J family partition protein [Acetobacteraceae bacterium]
MGRRSRAPSPILGAVAATIEAESRALVTNSGFRHTFEVPVGAVEADPGQPRRAFDDDGLRQLAATMDDRGQLQPILLHRHPKDRNRWVIVAGERRWRAAGLLGWKTMLAIEHDGDPEVVSLLENLQRVDLTVVEEARGVRRLMESKGWTQSQAAEAVGRSKGEMSAVLRVLHLPQDLLDQVLTSEPPVPRNTLIELARIKEPGEQRRLVAAMRDGGMTIRELRQAKAAAEHPGTPAPIRFSTTVLDRLAQRLGELRAAGHILDEHDRQRLERLRTEIDALLG